jgi:hypothetical protein
MLTPAWAANRPPQALVLSDPAAETEAAFVHQVAEQVEAAGFEISFVDFDGLCRTNQLLSGNVDLLVLPDASRLPIAAAPPVEAFLKSSGNLLALGLPAWQSPLFKLNNRWQSRADYESVIAMQKPAQVLADFGSATLAQWRRQANDGTSPTTLELESNGQAKALHVIVSNLTGWDTVAGPDWTRPFPTGQSLTCFRAKGSARTTQLSVEWTEQDGSRWIAVVELTPEWKQYCLPPEAFKPWESLPSRGGAGDHLKVENARRFTVGVAFSHTAVGGGRHEYWIEDIGTAPNPFGSVAFPADAQIPVLETLCPDYLFFPVAGPIALSIPAGLNGAGFVPPQPLGVTEATQPRPCGAGFRQDRPWRWQPLLEARAPQGDYRGAVATLLVNAQLPFRGGVWAAFATTNHVFYQQPATLKILRETAARMREGIFLLEGGSEFFTLFEHQSCPLGARVANFGKRAAADLIVHLEVKVAGGESVAFSREWPVRIEPGHEQTVEAAWLPNDWPAGGYTVNVELLKEGRVVDRLSHPLNVWHPKSQPSFIEAREGSFWLAGNPWKAHGVNYMPSSGIGVGSEYFEYWLGRGAYDPEVIQRDLERVKAMNLNAVSVFIYHRSLGAQHLLDFLRRCEILGLRVNLSLRPGTPLDFRWAEMKELIEHYRIAQNDTVFAYDLAWEPSHFDHDHQKAYRPAWTAWLRKRYGDLAAAEKSWDVPLPDANPSAGPANPAPRETRIGEVPSSFQLFHDGPWRKLVADYRAFLDELLRDKYAEARRLARSIDPHHPVSFRMQLAGDPTHLGEGLLPYDFYGLADAVDIWEPEAYGRIGEWDRVRPGIFTAAYARLCDPQKPVLWAEMGYNVWNLNRMAPDSQKLDFAARFYRNFYQMLRQSGANGVFFWWYPGGFRLYENSDFGIINPDGTDRSITEIIRREGPQFLAAAKPPPPNTWLEVDRDQDARGLPGIYEAVKSDFWKATDDGKSIGLKWRRRPGS